MYVWGKKEKKNKKHTTSPHTSQRTKKTQYKMDAQQPSPPPPPHSTIAAAATPPTDRRTLGAFPVPSSDPRPAQYYSAPQKVNGKKNPEWLARRLEQTGSTCATLIGMSMYDNGSPVKAYYKAIGVVKEDFKGNEDTDYGERYEDRVRAIGTAVLDVRILETGLFRDRVRRHIGVSLDGETNALRLVGWSDAWPARSERVEWELGKCIWEAKSSLRGLKSAPQIPHLMQLTLQMYVRRRQYGFLHYWSVDKTRIWLVKFSPQLWQWIMRRLDLLHMHVVRQSNLVLSDPYFPWLRSQSDDKYEYGKTCADYLMSTWFKSGKRLYSTPPPRGPIPYAYWVDTLACMRIRPGHRPADEPRPGEPGHDDWLYWLDDAPGGAETAPAVELDEYGAEQSNDVAQQPLPPKPEIWLIYDFARQVPDEEILDLYGKRVMVRDHDVNDIAWFKQEFPSIGKYAEYMLSQPDCDTNNALFDAGTQAYPVAAAHLRGIGPDGTVMRHLFVERLESMPALDEPDPVDQSEQDTPDEHLLFLRTLEEKLQARAEEDAKEAAEAAHKALLDAQWAALLSPPKIPVATLSSAVAADEPALMNGVKRAHEEDDDHNDVITDPEEDECHQTKRSMHANGHCDALLCDDDGVVVEEEPPMSPLIMKM